MSDATTTADGFRVGRRVRYRWNHECRGEITAKTTDHLDWHVKWDSGEQCPVLQNDIVLLPEPDAPATPEPRFKPGDEVTFTSCTGDAPRDATVIGQGRPSSTGEATWHILFPNGGRTSVFDGELEPRITPEPAPADDPVNRPSHYTQGGIECIDAIKAALTPEEFKGYLKGNVLKYGWRERHKGGVESLRKARWYLDKLIAESATN